MDENKVILEEEEEIDLLELFSLLWNNILPLIALAVGAGILALLVCKFLITPQYTASIDLIVNTRQDNSATVTNDNINSAKSLASTYAVVIKSNLVLDEVIQTLGLDMTYKELAQTISVESVNSTQIMEITVKNADPALAGKIVEAIATIAPDMIVDTVEAGSCKIVSKVDINEKPVSPNTKRDVALAMVAAFVLAYGILVLNHLLHNYIEDDEDVQKQLDLPVLGLIPEI